MKLESSETNTPNILFNKMKIESELYGDIQSQLEIIDYLMYIQAKENVYTRNFASEDKTSFLGLNNRFDQAVGRKLLLVDELPQGALARYERDVAAIAHVIARRGAVPDQIQEGEEILVPTFEIAANPQVRLSEIKARR